MEKVKKQYSANKSVSYSEYYPMQLAEKIKLLAFMGTIFCVYATELALLALLVYGKSRHLSIADIYFCKAAWVVHGLALLGLLCFIYGYFVEPYWLQVNETTINTDKLSTRLRIVHITDLHCELKFRNEERAVKIINQLKPDIVVFTGDSMNDPGAMKRFQNTLGSLKAKLGKFAVNGNFEDWYYPNLSVFANTGFKVLNHDTVTLQPDAGPLTISGLSARRQSEYIELLKPNDPNQFNIFLHHYPDLIEDIDAFGVDLYLCGHTHGGQVALPFYGAVITMAHHGKKYEAGRYDVGDTLLYVNRGLGLDGGKLPRVRFCARPEIAVFDIVPSDQKHGERN